MFVGGLIWPSRVVIARLDTDATRAAGGYDDDFNEFVRVDSDGDGIGEDQRLEKGEIRLNAQIATRRHEYADQSMHGQVPLTDDLELTFSFEELQAKGLRAADVGLRKNLDASTVIVTRPSPKSSVIVRGPCSPASMSSSTSRAS